MKQRAVLIALVLVCLMTMFALVEVRGWEGSEKKPERRPMGLLRHQVYTQ